MWPSKREPLYKMLEDVLILNKDKDAQIST